MKFLKRTFILALVLIVGVAAFAGCNEKTEITTGVGTFSGTMREGAENTGSYFIEDSVWAGLTKAEFNIKYDLENLNNGDHYSRVFKVSGVPTGAKVHLFAIDEVDGIKHYWDVLNNLGAIETGDGEELYASVKDEYSGYWSAKTGNLKSASSTAQQKFYFVADKVGTYTITCDIVSYPQGVVKGTTKTKVIVK